MSRSPAEQLTRNTVRLVCTKADGSLSFGTGFFFSLLKSESVSAPVIVTNKHVVKDAVSLQFSISRLPEPSILTNERILPISISVNLQQRIIHHPDPSVDLCLIPVADFLNQLVSSKVNPDIIFLDSSLIPTSKEWDELTSVEDILMIGYPDAIWDPANNQPITRKGITATHPNLDYNGKREFLVDTGVFPGSSGSPIFLYNVGSYPVRTGIAIGTRVKLLGIIHSVLTNDIQGEVFEDIPTTKRQIAEVHMPNNLGMSIKSSMLFDFEPIVKEMLEKEIKSRANAPGTST